MGQLQLPAVKLEAVSKQFNQTQNNPIQAVDNVSLTISTGQVFGLLGPNGAGKTTLLKMLNGRSKPDTGRIYINGYDLGIDRVAALQQSAMMFSEEDHLISWELPVWEKLVFAKYQPANSANELDETLKQHLDDLGLWPYRDVIARDLPSDLQRKLAFVCITLSNAPILLLDEPTLGLDDEGVAAIKAQIKALVQKQGKTVVIATQKVNVAQELCDQVAILKAGHLIVTQALVECACLSHYQPSLYQIRVKGHLQARWSAQLGNMHLENIAQGDTLITGVVVDQAALHGILATIRNLALPLISVMPLSSDLDELYDQLIEKDADPHRQQSDQTNKSAMVV